MKITFHDRFLVSTILTNLLRKTVQRTYSYICQEITFGTVVRFAQKQLFRNCKESSIFNESFKESDRVWLFDRNFILEYSSLSYITRTSDFQAKSLNQIHSNYSKLQEYNLHVLIIGAVLQYYNIQYNNIQYYKIPHSSIKRRRPFYRWGYFHAWQ